MNQTIQNLAKAFVGESQARNRYTMYAKAAINEGYEQIAAIFLETAEQEREHASQLFKMIGELKASGGEAIGDISIEAEVPTVKGTTAENLEAAIKGEHYEYSSMYPGFADIADSEGLGEVAAKLRAIAKAETNHERKYMILLERVKAGTVFTREEETGWECRKCGYLHKGKTAPEQCPSCGHPQSFYQEPCI